MDIATKIIGLMGTAGTVYGLFFVFQGTMEYFQADKSENAVQRDKAVKSIVNGAILAAVSVGIATTIIASLNAIQW